MINILTALCIHGKGVSAGRRQLRMKIVEKSQQPPPTPLNGYKHEKHFSVKPGNNYVKLVKNREKRR